MHFSVISKPSEPSANDSTTSKTASSETNGMNDLLTGDAREESISEVVTETENNTELRRRRLEKFSQNVENIDAVTEAES